MIQKLANNNIIMSNNALLTVPAEICNRICRFALIEDDAIIISGTTSAPPGLLSVSRQIREETIYLYYTENEFDLEVLDYSVEAVLPSYSIQKKYFKPNKREPDAPLGISFKDVVIYFSLRRMPNWHNFMGWCAAKHRGEIFGMCAAEDCNRRNDIVVASVFEAMEAMKTRSWAEVEGVLHSFRRLMVLLDPAWAT